MARTKQNARKTEKASFSKKGINAPREQNIRSKPGSDTESDTESDEEVSSIMGYMVKKEKKRGGHCTGWVTREGGWVTRDGGWEVPTESDEEDSSIMGYMDEGGWKKKVTRDHEVPTESDDVVLLKDRMATMGLCDFIPIMNQNCSNF
jgi:hypothetical protein